MEPRDRDQEAVTAESSARHRVRMIALSVLLVALCMVQSPGQLVADTKIDLVLDPLGFLGEASHLWDAKGAFGQVQNQAYGYFFPMGAWFAGGASLGIDAWIVQRLWWGLLLVVSFVGAERLLSALGLGRPITRVLGALSYTLAPRVLGLLGVSSIEAWPASIGPWILLPLVVGLHRRPVLMAAVSASAAGFLGGVNAAADLAAVLPAGLWLVVHLRLGAARRMLLVWIGAMVLATAWWVVPLIVLGRYSPPFLDYIESAGLTTFSGDLVDGLRGTSNWTFHLAAQDQAGWLIVTSSVLLLFLGVLVALSAAGLASRSLPHRTFLLTLLVVGLLVVGLGHSQSGGWGSARLQELLDGPAAPLRNTHKFDLLVQLALAAGLTHAATRWGSLLAQASGSTSRVAARFAPSVVALVVAMSALPLWSGSVGPSTTFTAVPDYWEQAADWADENVTARALLVPGSGFGDYLWGKVNDEPFQALSDAPFAVRNSIPLAPSDNIELLDAIQESFAQGTGSKALVSLLSRSGVSHLVVRNDLRPSADVIEPALVHATLASMPGVERVATFGPEIGGGPAIDSLEARTFADGGRRSLHPAIEVYEVPGAQTVSAVDLDEVDVVVGGPGALLEADDAGVAEGEVARLAHDLREDEVPDHYLLTDDQRRQEIAFGRASSNRGATAGEDEPPRVDRARSTYRDEGADGWDVVARLEGARSITASSSQAWSDTTGTVRLDRHPFAAFDSDLRTAWAADGNDLGKRSWLRIELDEATDVSDLSVVLQQPELESTALTVRADEQVVTVSVDGSRRRSVSGLTLPTRSLEISAPARRDPLTVADVDIPGTTVTRPLVVPEVPDPWGAPKAIVLDATTGARDGCVDVDGYTRCQDGLSSLPEDGVGLDRWLEVPLGTRYTPTVTVSPVGGAEWDELVQKGVLSSIAASSQSTYDPRAGALAAADGNPETAWIADPDDARPVLSLRWVRRERVRGLTLHVDDLVAAARPTRVRIQDDRGRERTLDLDEDGSVRFPSFRTASLRIEVLASTQTLSWSSTGDLAEVPVGVSEVSVLGPAFDVTPVRVPLDDVRLPCGDGPTLHVGDQSWTSALTVSRDRGWRNATVSVTRCTGPRHAVLQDGAPTRVTVDSAPGVQVDRLVLDARRADEGAARAASTVPSSVRSWGRDHREVAVGATDRDRMLVVRENENPGWTSPDAQAVTVMGWAQGYVVPAGTDSVRLDYAPSATYRASLIVGGVFLLLLWAGTCVAAIRARRAIRKDSEEAASRGLRWLPVSGVALLAVVSLGAWGTVVAALAAAGSWALTRLRVPLLVPSVVGVLLAGVFTVASWQPWAGSGAWAGGTRWLQLLVLATLVLTVWPGRRALWQPSR